MRTRLCLLIAALTILCSVGFSDNARQKFEPSTLIEAGGEFSETPDGESISLPTDESPTEPPDENSTPQPTDEIPTEPPDENSTPQPTDEIPTEPPDENSPTPNIDHPENEIDWSDGTPCLMATLEFGLRVYHEQSDYNLTVQTNQFHGACEGNVTADANGELYDGPVIIYEWDAVPTKAKNVVSVHFRREGSTTILSHVNATIPLEQFSEDLTDLVGTVDVDLESHGIKTKPHYAYQCLNRTVTAGNNETGEVIFRDIVFQAGDHLFPGTFGDTAVCSAVNISATILFIFTSLLITTIGFIF